MRERKLMVGYGNSRKETARTGRNGGVAAFSVFFIFFLSLSIPAFADYFNPAQVNYIFNPQSGAESDVQRFYHYFKKDRDPALIVPGWVDQIMPAMLAHPVWQDPEQGMLNEAQIWQGPPAVLYEVFELTRKTLSPKDGGQLQNPKTLAGDYETERIRFEMALDRLYRARLENSLAGRGREEMAIFSLIDKEMESLITGLTNGNVEEYRQGLMAIAMLSKQAFQRLNQPPAGYAPPDVPGPASPALATFLTLVGVAVMLFGGWLLGSLNKSQLQEATDRYKAKAKEWAYEYQRQFLSVKVNYLVGGPIILGFLVGLLTFNIFGFIIFFGLGTYAGLILPGWLLQNIRFRRGMKCEKQLMDALILMSNGLKAGVDLVQCFGMVQKDLQPPISEEFGLCLKNYQLGTSIEKALEGMEERVQSRLLSYFIKAIVIQRTAGGNLTKLFDRIVENIREETKLVEKTAAMTAQQRIQAIVVGIMPWIMLLVMFLFQPQQMSAFYFSPLGVITLLFCTVWIAIGMKVVNKLGDVQV